MNEHTKNNKADTQVLNDARHTNKYKTRIIESEINAGLFLQILIHYNFYASFICFSFQIFTNSFKIWAFKQNNFTVIRFFLLIFWGFIESHRLKKGYASNITESFPELISFDLMTIVFSLPPQLLVLAGDPIMPIDKSTFIVYICFAVLEIITSIFVMSRIIKRKAAVYFLQNTTTETNSSIHNRVKSSEEIKEEVEMLLGSGRSNNNNHNTSNQYRNLNHED